MTISKTTPPADEAKTLPVPVDPRSGGNGDLRSEPGIDDLPEEPEADRKDAFGQPGFGDDRVTPHLNDGR